MLSPLLSDAPIRNLAGRNPGTSVQTLFGRLRDELRPYVPEDVTVATRVRTDSDTDGILTTAASIDADLIAVGTHGYAAWQQAGLPTTRDGAGPDGSTALGPGSSAPDLAPIAS